MSEASDVCVKTASCVFASPGYPRCFRNAEGPRCASRDAVAVEPRRICFHMLLHPRRHCQRPIRHCCAANANSHDMITSSCNPRRALSTLATEVCCSRPAVFYEYKAYVRAGYPDRISPRFLPYSGLEGGMTGMPTMVVPVRTVPTSITVPPSKQVRSNARMEYEPRSESAYLPFPNGGESQQQQQQQSYLSRTGIRVQDAPIRGMERTISSSLQRNSIQVRCLSMIDWATLKRTMASTENLCIADGTLSALQDRRLLHGRIVCAR